MYVCERGWERDERRQGEIKHLILKVFSWLLGLYVCICAGGGYCREGGMQIAVQPCKLERHYLQAGIQQKLWISKLKFPQL